jgi:hypothetical protein
MSYEYDDDQGPLDSDCGDSEADHVWSDLARSESEPEPLECLEESPECSGDVEYRMPLSGTGRAFPRCEFHWDKRLEQQEKIERKYAVNSSVPPEGFDPADAGEHWDYDY